MIIFFILRVLPLLGRAPVVPPPFLIPVVAVRPMWNGFPAPMVIPVADVPSPGLPAEFPSAAFPDPPIFFALTVREPLGIRNGHEESARTTHVTKVAHDPVLLSVVKRTCFALYYSKNVLSSYVLK